MFIRTSIWRRTRLFAFDDLVVGQFGLDDEFDERIGDGAHVEDLRRADGQRPVLRGAFQPQRRPLGRRRHRRHTVVHVRHQLVLLHQLAKVWNPAAPSQTETGLYFEHLELQSQIPSSSPRDVNTVHHYVSTD